MLGLFLKIKYILYTIFSNLWYRPRQNLILHKIYFKKKSTAGVLWVIKVKAIAFCSLSLLQNNSFLWHGIIFRNVKCSIYGFHYLKRKRGEGGKTLWFWLKVELV